MTQKDEPFWLNNQPINVYETLPDGYVEVKSVFDFLILKPYSSDYYEMKKGRFILKDEKYVEYEIKDGLRDFQLTEYIKSKQCYIKSN